MTAPKPSKPCATPLPGRFCPSCGAIADLDEILCAECGDETALLGYCDVCERFWRLPEGFPCPKHDVLLAAAATEPARRDQERVDWVTVKSFPTLPLAEAPRIRLEAEGIPTFLDGERMAGNLLHNTATGGVKLQVPRELIDQARVLLDQTWSLPEEHADEIDDAWEELAPEPGEKRRIVMRAAIVVFLLLPILRVVVLSLFRR